MAKKEKVAEGTPEWGTEKGKWGAEMAKLPGALQDWNDPHENCIRITRSPSVGFTFANGYGLPRGYTLMWYGVQKGGKSVGCYDTVGALHEDSPTAEAAYYSTEYRIKLQLTPARARMHGIDPKRLHRFQTNKPEGIFDVIEKDIDEKCRKRGMDLQLIVIDSASQIQGRQAANKESVLDYTVGDHAQTMQIGLQRILPVIRDNNIALILIVHVRSEMDQQVLQREGRKMGGSIKPQASWATKHFAEYFMYSERDDTKAGREGLTNENLQDMRSNGEGEITGSRMRCLMKENSCGPRGRMGLYTFDSHRGIINVHEEVFELCKNRGVIEQSGSTYKFDTKSWRGREAALEELSANLSLQKEMMAELRRRDNAGAWSQDEVSEMDKKTKGITEMEIDLRQSHELEQ